MSSNIQIIEEQITWTIDWVNTIFTIVNTPITNGLSLYFNGIAQSSWIDYLLVGNTITFVIAPAVGSILMARIITSIDITVSSSSTLTLSNITDKIFKKMWIKSDSTVFDRSDIVIPKLNLIIGDICAWQVTNILNPEITYKSWFLRFLAKKFFFKTKSPVKLTTSTSGWTISFDTTDFETSWNVIINEDIITYTWKTSTQLTWVTWLSYNHDEWSIAEQVFELPTNAWKNFNLWNIDREQTTPIKYQDDRAQKDYSPYWTLKFDSSSDKEFIYIKNINDTNFILDYYAKSTDLVEDTDISILPDNFMEWIAIPLTAWILLYSTYWDDTLWLRWKSLIQDWYHSLQSLYWQKAERVREFRKIVKRPSWGHRTYVTNNTCDNNND